MINENIRAVNPDFAAMTHFEFVHGSIEKFRLAPVRLRWKIIRRFVCTAVANISNFWATSLSTPNVMVRLFWFGSN